MIALACRLCLVAVLVAPSAMAQTVEAPAASEPLNEIGLDPMARRYQLGQGYRIGDSGFTLGGYGEAVARDDRERDPEASLESLSALLWWDGGGRWHFFSELELEDALITRPGDTTTDDALKFRLGKFLTPVGRWNLIHAAPLTWTTSRPLITEATFPTNTTGGMVYGVLPWTADGVEYSLYATPGEELFPEDDIDTFKEAVGARLASRLLPNTQFGLSYVNFEQEQSAEERKQLIGADFLWQWHRHELSGEIAYRNVARGGESRDEEGAYLQYVAPLSQTLYAVVRYETFQVREPGPDVELFLGGLNWRPRPAVALKAEYSRLSGESADIADGFLASIAVLF
jgi:hypothetical protein